MKRTLKCVIATVGAAAIAVGTAVPASAFSFGNFNISTKCPSSSNSNTNTNSNKSSCGLFGSSDINSLFQNYSSCFDILKNYGIELPDCYGNSCTGGVGNNSSGNQNSGGSVIQKPSSNNCPGGNCVQKPTDNNCPDGNCVQKPTDSNCPGGNCLQKPTDNDCPDGNCGVQTPSKPDTDTSSSVSDYEKKVVELVNEIRRDNGLSELKINTELCTVARAKSQDMKDKNYFSHTSPTYGSPFDMMKTFGISYRTAGENIAMGYSTPEAVVNAWMNSEGHRANILKASYKEIGVGYVASGNYWTQMFIG